MKLHNFNHLVIGLTDKLYRFARQMLQDEMGAKDVVQDTFLKLWQQRKELDKVKNLEAYAYTMVKNKCLDILKSSGKNLSENETPNQLVTTENEYDKKEEMQIVKSLINELPIQQRMILQLREIEGKTFEEIAEILNLQEGNLRVILSRTRTQLKKQLENIYEYGTTGN